MLCGRRHGVIGRGPLLTNGLAVKMDREAAQNYGLMLPPYCQDEDLEELGKLISPQIRCSTCNRHQERVTAGSETPPPPPRNTA